MKFDGHEVSLHEGKLSGGFDIDEDVAASLKIDDVVTFVVTARMNGASMDETKMGDLKRTNKFGIANVVMLSARTASELLVQLPQMAARAELGGGEFGLDDDEEEPSVAPVPEPVDSGDEDETLKQFLYGGS